jgi:hypothetical protein
MPTNASNNELIHVTATRRLHHLELLFRSEPLEGAMKALSREQTILARNTDSTNRDGWGPGHRLYQVECGPNGSLLVLPAFNLGRFDQWGSRRLVFDNNPRYNLTPLLTVGLETGVNIRINTVISDTQLNEYLEGIKSAARQFYIDYLRDSQTTVTITTETSFNA